MLVIFNIGSITPENRKLFTISTKSPLIICQECWKKRGVIPSGPGAFFGLGLGILPEPEPEDLNQNRPENTGSGPGPC